MESKPHEKIDLLITASENIYQTKRRKKKYSNTNENMAFWRKTDKKNLELSFLREPLPPFQLTTYFWAIFLLPRFVPIFKKEGEGEKLCPSHSFSSNHSPSHSYHSPFHSFPLFDPGWRHMHYIIYFMRMRALLQWKFVTEYHFHCSFTENQSISLNNHFIL